jgi:hypothetical protein
MSMESASQSSLSPTAYRSNVEQQTVSAPAPWYERLLEANLLPDALIRLGIRRLLALRLRQENLADLEGQKKRLMDFVSDLKQRLIALHTSAANAQHYEVPARFFELVLGPHHKYSSAYWGKGVSDLATAEEAMLELTVNRARLADGKAIPDGVHSRFTWRSDSPTVKSWAFPTLDPSASSSNQRCVSVAFETWRS